MSELYTITDYGLLPVTVVEFKDFRKLPQVNTSQDATITTMLKAATAFGEGMTGKDFRDNTYTLRIDEFPVGCGIVIERAPVETITSITYTVAGVETTVDPSIYYLTPELQYAVVNLSFEKVFPVDGDELSEGLQGSINVNFVTGAYTCDGRAKMAIMEHVNALFSERGDCSSGSVRNAAMASGAYEFYNQFRTARVC
jgi:uncharacterized phiE125 gp8 family phage protein